MRRCLVVLALSAALAAGYCAAGVGAPSAPANEVAWLFAATDADIERAFAQARSERKSVLVYWGAKWCPPCNQLKATLFNRQDFIERSASFVSVNIDGDLPGAQKLGARFKVRGYPTLILLRGDGVEITRLPGEVDAAQVMHLLHLGLTGGRPVMSVLADARAGMTLSGNEWRMLAYYSWETDEQRLVPSAERAGLLAALAAASPAGVPEVSSRLWLKAIAAQDGRKGNKPDAALRERVRKVLADAATARVHMDVLTGSAASIAKALAPRPGVERSALVAAFNVALKRLEADSTLSRADRLNALLARVDLARLDQAKDIFRPKLPRELLTEVRAHVARADREISDGYERQAVITAAADLLWQSGQWRESDELLKANLSKSHSPYYLMSQLAGNARKRGSHDEALRWYGAAFERSEGSATRLQWGASYVSALVDLAPNDLARIESVVLTILQEAAVQPNALYERSARALLGMGGKLASWNGDRERGNTMLRLRQRVDTMCAKLDASDPQLATCKGLLKPDARKRA